MHKHTFGVLIVVALFALGAACSKPTTNTQTTNQPAATNTDVNNTTPVTAEETLTLSNLGGVSFAGHNTSTGMAGDISMSKTYLDAGAGRTVPVFLFGQPLPGRDHVQLNPNLEFGGMTAAINVVAAIDGVVGFVRQQSDSNDYEVFLMPKENSIWTIGYDHLTDVTVKQGDTVTVGQVLGKAARENNGMYRYELQINKDVAGVTTFHCPMDLLRDDVKATQNAAIEQFIREWNTFYGSDVYSPYTTACAKSVLTLAETQ
jgi:murein DD-endopeptidase MepM/ murein hydrolase activator NlpD